MIKVTLSDEQLEQLAPLFAKVRESKAPGMIAAQIFPDGMVVDYIDAKSADALCVAVSGGFNSANVVHSAKEVIDRAHDGNQGH